MYIHIYFQLHKYNLLSSETEGHKLEREQGCALEWKEQRKEINDVTIIYIYYIIIL